MTHHIKAMSISLAMVGLLWPMTAQPQTNNDYAAIPPFVSSVSTPNVLIILDNSGSMGRRANCDFGSGAGPGGYDTCPTFDETKTYGGLFDPSKCYLYDGPPNVSPDLRFEPNSTKATMATKCANNTEWDGNFLNWVTLRRLDMAKAALIGGVCSVARNASGDCPTTGTPPMVTIKGLDNKAMPSGAQISTSPVPVGGGSNQTRGRLPQSLETSAGANLRFHLGGTTGSGPWPLMGQFCVDDDATLPAANALNCTDGDLYNETGYRIQVALPAQPLGVIQTTGSKVRFGLMEYRGNDGGQVMVPLGSKLYRQLNVSSVSSSNNNTLAMIKGIEDTFNEGNTPMAETFYEATRYIGQMGSSFTTSYVYPIAFSPGVSLAVNGEGGMGLGEVKDLTGTEACPTGMGYVTDACGRDPFFFGSAHSPAWASPSALIPCCQTFIVVFTDGDSQQDQTIPASLTDFAHSVHGVHCTGNDVSSPAAAIDTTCNMHPLTAPKDMIKEHRTDYSNSGSHFLDDVAYWAHISDLRAATVTAQVPGGGPLNTVWTGGQDLPGIQNVTTYTFFAFSQMLNREFLMQTARQGGFEDKNANLIPDNGLTPAAACDDVDLTKPCEYDAVDNLTGAAGRDGTPDTFFESSDVVFMKTKLTDVINHILSKTSSGSSLSVLASSATGEGALYQSYFFPKLQDPVLNTTINWLGFTHGLFIDTFGNIREDTDQNARLWYKNDKIIKTRFDATLNKLLIDRYDDLDMNGLPDDKNSDGVINQLDCNPCNSDLSTLKPIWEGGNRLAQQTAADRKILTWLDNSGGTDNKIVDSGEVIDFTTANCASLKEFLRKVGDLCGVGSPAYNIIDFIRGNQPAGTRDRIRKVGGVDKVWKFGDTIHSTPTEAGPPRERYDVIYGDAGYVDYYRHWRDRRRVVYVGANDGMLHAFNAGFYNRGDDPSTTSNPLEIEHGWFTTTALSATPATTRGAFLGDELWAFIPQELLPHLEWLTSTSYNHVYYVDLKPKITDARIFTAEAACSANAGDPANTACKHPGGWGTILIGGFRMGGSCGTCASGTGAPPMTIPIGGVNRTFYSAYFVLDITDPENDPKLLWVFSDSGMGLSTSYPSVVRVNPTGIPKSDISQEKWFMVVGSGPNGYNADFSGSAQKPKLYAVNLKNGPVGAGNMQPFPVEPTWNGMMGEIITFDKDLDFRVDTAYAGSTLHDGALPWRGKLHRLTMGKGLSASPGPPVVVADPFGAQTDVTKWGVDLAGVQVPNVLLNTFPAANTIEMGPITTAPAVTLDDANNVWVFAGSGRYYSISDKINSDTQYFVGVKDPVLTGTCNQTTTNCTQNDLVDVSAATVCVLGQGACVAGNQVTGVGGAQSFLSLIGTVQSKHGWYTTLSLASRERMIANPVLLGGAVLFPTFIPENDACSSTGDSNLYALFYKTGSAFSSPVIGSTAGMINKTQYIDKGVASAVAIHVGSQGPGGNPTGVTGCVQASSSAVTCMSVNPASPVTSRYISWMQRRN